MDIDGTRTNHSELTTRISFRPAVGPHRYEEAWFRLFE